MSLRDTMLNIARRAILDRAALDGYVLDDYNPEEDPEGYVVSLLTALRHWCKKYGIDWPAELARAQELFEEDLQEEEESENASQSDDSVRAQSPVKDAADKIFEIVCESDWPEQPDAWPQDATVHALEEMRQQRNAGSTEP